ncbi:Chitin synthase 4 [Gnomoniopsis smithogilvyi]|uniref:Chitin synthase 4 n=1 Tax=Gnomoniopsis smithogilvyi TaxID=1191159 RepID=A0A9W8Z368_9PEZI|nr:Chitin synthase 4 [Gnomoniopsis smithogilvyi]
MAAADSSQHHVSRAPVSPNPSAPQNVHMSIPKELPPVSIPAGSRLGHSPVSPVKMSHHPDDWAQPSSAVIETRDSAYSDGLQRSSTSFDDDRSLTLHAPQRPAPGIPVEIAQPAGTVQRAQAGFFEHPVFGDGLDYRLHSVSGDISTQAVRSSNNEGSSVNKGHNRHSRETDASMSSPCLSNPLTSTEVSVATSASSVSADMTELERGQHRKSEDSSSAGDPADQPQMVPQLEYHHQPITPRNASFAVNEQDSRVVSSPDLSENGPAVNRHLTPVSNFRRSSMPRPLSTYSLHSERDRSGQYGTSSPRAPSAHSSRRSPNISENRQSTYAELLNVPYPQPAPAPLTVDNSQLRNVVGSNASLLSSQKTLEMYRQNVKKTNDFSIQYSFAVFLISTAQENGLDVTLEPKKKPSTPKPGHSPNSSVVEGPESNPNELVREARAILQKLANAGYPFAQYYLADGYASGLFSKGKEDYNSAFPLFVLAAKHGHAESAYRTGLCYEFGWGCRKDPAKAVQFLRTAASKRHPGAMTRLGKACLSGDLGEKRYREGLKWLKLATESADSMYNAAPFHLGSLYETGYGEDIFKDEGYAAELFTQAADLGHSEANFRMGDAYEHGKLSCPRDPALSVHFYTGAAERGHAGAMMGLCAWYMVGAEPILEKDEEEAYEWARRAAELGTCIWASDFLSLVANANFHISGLVKAQYAIGYFTEMGIGCRRDILEANVWYVKAAEAGDVRASQRLSAIRAAASGGRPMDVAPPKNPNLKKKNAAKDENCLVM